MIWKMSFEVLNWTSHLIALIGVLLLCWPTFWFAKFIRKFETHKKIEVTHVQTAQVFENESFRNARPEEIELMVDWFNGAAFIQKREYENPRSGKEGVILKLTSGEHIYIVPRDGDFDVTRRQMNQSAVTYWVRQSELGKFLGKFSS